MEEGGAVGYIDFVVAWKDGGAVHVFRPPLPAVFVRSEAAVEGNRVLLLSHGKVVEELSLEGLVELLAREARKWRWLPWRARLALLFYEKGTYRRLVVYEGDLARL